MSGRGSIQPKVLEHYEAVLSGAADRILRMAEGDLSHRHAMERDAMEVSRIQVTSDFSRAMRGFETSGRWLLW